MAIEGIAEDETVEAIRVRDAAGFALGVQWHAEHDPATNPINRTLFEAFGSAAATRHRARAAGRAEPAAPRPGAVPAASAAAQRRSGADTAESS
ncbi:gamma-glutamyl-gamma-aminobutyrate hydrolase family protein [Methylobacterium oryzae CBMB20]